jgi:hypothetical protein
VAVNPYENPPKGRFLFRLLIPGVPVVMFGVLMVGLISLEPSMRPRAPASSSGGLTLPETIPAPPMKRTPGWFGPSKDFYRGLALEFQHLPDSCWNGAESEFQKVKCQEAWTRLLRLSALALLPLGAFFAFVLFALDSLKLTYRRIRKKIGESQYMLKATVTRPARARGDPFAWFYCLHCISVELQDKTQMRVYLSPHENIPFPGDTVAVFKLGRSLGRKRYMATLYAPHVAVFAATRAK